MSYTVLARKWRPDHFDEVVGQDHVARTLTNSIEQGRVAHSYLFCGARGVGKTSTARILAKAMNCHQGPTPRPCYDCPSCDEISRGQSVDVFEIDGASNRGINEIRELREGVRYAPSRDEHKIYIIDEVHMLTTEAFNALLKTLEEPPPHAIFIFATTEPQKIPVTILSRCQRFDFKRISQRDIVDHLLYLCDEEGFVAEKAALQIIARQANGGMRDALSLLDQIISFSGKRITEEEIAEILGVANRKHLFELSDAVLRGETEEALLVLDEVNRYGYDLQQFASELVNHFRDLMVTAVVKEPQKVTALTESELEQARAQVQGMNGELMNRYFTVMVDGASEMNRSAYPKLIFEMTVVRLCELEPMANLDVLVERLHLLEESLDGDAAPVQWPTPSSQTRREESSQEEEKRERSGKGKARAEEDSARAQGSKAKREEDKPDPPTPEPEAAPAKKDKPSPEKEPKERGRREERPPVDAYESPEVSAKRAPQESTRESSEAEPDTRMPSIPQPLSPSEEADVEVPSAKGVQEATERWRLVVDYLRQKNAPVALACEYGYPERFGDGVVAVSFEEGYLDLALEEKRKSALERAIKEIFGSAWTLELERRDPEEADGVKTLAKEREEDIARRREKLEESVRSHPVIEKARQLFDASDPRVKVRLYDE